MDTAWIVLRVALSLGVVLALLWVLHRRVSTGRFGAAATKGRRSASVEVVGRQGIGGKASVVVVDVEGERLVLGVSEHGVRLLTSGQAPAPELAIVTGPVQLPARPTPSADAFRRELDQQTAAAPSLQARPERRRRVDPEPAGGAGLPSDAAEPLPMRPRNRRSQRTALLSAQQLQGRSCPPTPGGRPPRRSGTGGSGERGADRGPRPPVPSRRASGGSVVPGGTPDRPRPAGGDRRRRLPHAHRHRCSRRRRRAADRTRHADRPVDG
ncbi:flagellar biosynthetic protein FliO [Curtobacterium flaccumfaciens]|nr:flagellar biosynthetic protein FliO [Curtobacterium flaccumfaciens]